MKAYEVIIPEKIDKKIKKLPKNVQDNLTKAFNKLAVNPRPSGCKKLQSKETYRLRLGNYRLIYKVIDKEVIVLIVEVGHRQGIYNKK